jgi:4a-hydroxytetrahydrobiopterin dehydratase
MTGTLTRDGLVQLKSKALEGSKALDQAAITAQLKELPDWHLKQGAIERSLAFSDYYETMAFLNALAFVVHAEDHHPDISFGYNQAVVRFNTHSVKGISLNDFICAAKCDAIYSTRHLRKS